MTVTLLLLQVEKHKDTVKVEGERIVLEEFPKRILELNAFLADSRMVRARRRLATAALGRIRG